MSAPSALNPLIYIYYKGFTSNPPICIHPSFTSAGFLEPPKPSTSLIIANNTPVKQINPQLSIMACPGLLWLLNTLHLYIFKMFNSKYRMSAPSA